MAHGAPFGNAFRFLVPEHAALESIGHDQGNGFTAMGTRIKINRVVMLADPRHEIPSQDRGVGCLVESVVSLPVADRVQDRLAKIVHEGRLDPLPDL